MKIRRAHSYRQLVGRSGTKLLVTVADSYALSSAELVYRAGYETNNIARVSRFVRIDHAYRVPYERTVIPVGLTRKGCTFVEVLDTATNTSAVFILRHGPYTCPYKIEDKVVTSVQVTEAAAESAIDRLVDDEAITTEDGRGDVAKDFFGNLLALARVVGDDDGVCATNSARDELRGDEIVVETTITADPAKDTLAKNELEYRAGQIVASEAKTATFLSGLYWCDYEHWKVHNAPVDAFRRTPGPKTLYCLSYPVAIRSAIAIMRTSFVQELCLATTFGVNVVEASSSVPNFPREINSVLDAVADRVYRMAAENVGAALLNSGGILLGDNVGADVAFCDYEESTVIVTRRGYYGWLDGVVNGDPLNPVHNEFFRERWHLKTYCEHLNFLSPSGEGKRDGVNSHVVRFIVRGCEVVGITHSNGNEYGRVTTDTEATLRTFTARMRKTLTLPALAKAEDERYALTRIEQIIGEGFGFLPEYTCTFDTRTGRLTIRCEMFPKGKGVIMRIGHGLTRSEVEHVMRVDWMGASFGGTTVHTV
jgi:hypothetical protein